MSEKLLPCPFCGGEAEIATINDKYVFVGCKKCGCRTRGYLGTEDVDQINAINDWNTRQLQPLDEGEVIEALAEYAHKAWSGWMKYLFEKSNECIDGTYEIPTWAVERWKRQITAEYKELPENEKESDREEARRMLAICAKFGKAGKG